MRLLLILSILAFASSAHALSCAPCDTSRCANVTCESTVVKDPCMCCPVCSKTLYEECGGPWNISGICDPATDLVCKRFVPPGVSPFNFRGRCLKNSTKDVCSYPQIYKDCASACQPSCDEPNPLICTMQCVEDHCECGPGFIRKAGTNKTCIPTDECDNKPQECEGMKIFKECATACPSTCGNPFPFLCTKNCAMDHCVCPEGYLMKSLTERHCIRDYECANFSFCERDCPALNVRASVHELRKMWSCNLQQWNCQAYKWKLEMKRWWVESCNGDSDSVENIWEDMDANCDQMPSIRCKNPDATMCNTDAFGCIVCQCSDGDYEDPNKLMLAWTITYNNYNAYLDLYRKAKDMCVGGC